MRRLLAWFRAHRIITWSLRVLLVLWGVHLWLNWAGECDWRQYCDQARQRGVKVTLAEFAQPEIPEAENFAGLPMFKAAFDALPDLAPSPFPIPKMPMKWLPNYGLLKNLRTDWEDWATQFKNARLIDSTSGDAPADVLRGLERFAPQMKEWHEGRARARCSFPVDWSAGMMVRYPHLTTLEEATTFFGLRMRAHLAQFNSAAALEDFHDVFQGWRALRLEPGLISGSYRLSTLRAICSHIGTGLAAHAWAEPDMRVLDAALAEVRIWDDYRFVLSSERAHVNRTFEQWAWATPWGRAQFCANLRFRGLRTDSTPPELLDYLVGFLFSRHKVRENQLRYNRYVDELLARNANEGGSLNTGQALPTGPDQIENFVQQWHFLLFRFSAWELSRDQMYLRMDAQVAETRTAIALERYYIAQGLFPKTLDELVPEFLPEVPVDPWIAKSMKYHRLNKAASYLLYGVGKDGKDDGGVIDMSRGESSQSDAIWLYAPP